MILNTITKEEHQIIVNVYENYPKLTFQNVGYQYIDKSKLNELELLGIKHVEAIMHKAIKGFRRFDNFKIRKSGEVVIRFQFDWSWSRVNDQIIRTSIPFTGVGYIGIDELLNGFISNES
jgi:hypothetical protein